MYFRKDGTKRRNDAALTDYNPREKTMEIGRSAAVISNAFSEGEMTTRRNSSPLLVEFVKCDDKKTLAPT